MLKSPLLDFTHCIRDSPGVTVISLSEFLFTSPFSLFCQVHLLCIWMLRHSVSSKASCTSKHPTAKSSYFQLTFIKLDFLVGSICRKGRRYFHWINWEGFRCFIFIRNSVGMLCNAFSTSFPNVPGTTHGLTAMISGCRRLCSAPKADFPSSSGFTSICTVRDLIQENQNPTCYGLQGAICLC